MAASRGEHNDQSQCVFHIVVPALGAHPIGYAGYSTLLPLFVVAHIALHISRLLQRVFLPSIYYVAISSETVEKFKSMAKTAPAQTFADSYLSHAEDNGL